MWPFLCLFSKRHNFLRRYLHLLRSESRDLKLIKFCYIGNHVGSSYLILTFADLSIVTTWTVTPYGVPGTVEVREIFLIVIGLANTTGKSTCFWCNVLERIEGLMPTRFCGKSALTTSRMRWPGAQAVLLQSSSLPSLQSALPSQIFVSAIQLQPSQMNCPGFLQVHSAEKDGERFF